MFLTLCSAHLARFDWQSVVSVSPIIIFILCNKKDLRTWWSKVKWNIDSQYMPCTSITTCKPGGGLYQCLRHLKKPYPVSRRISYYFFKSDNKVLNLQWRKSLRKRCQYTAIWVSFYNKVWVWGKLSNFPLRFWGRIRMSILHNLLAKLYIPRTLNSYERSFRCICLYMWHITKFQDYSAVCVA